MPSDSQNKVLHIIIVLLVFAITGTTATIFPSWVIPSSIEKGTVWYVVTYILLITPIYQVLLLAYAFLFGKFSYFWNKQKRLFRWITGRSVSPSEKPSSSTAQPDSSPTRSSAIGTSK